MKKSYGRSARLALMRYFVSGAMAILPLVITAAVVIWVAGIPPVLKLNACIDVFSN